MSKKQGDTKEKEYCPKCNSKDLNFMPWLGLIYECRKCGWRGPVVVRKKRIKKIKQKLKRNRKK